MDRKMIVIFGGGFNPVGMHHLQIVFDLLRMGFEVIIVPSGSNRPDKVIDHVGREHRIELIKLGFKFFLGSGVVRLDLSDLEKNVFTRTHELQARYEALGEIWHLVGADWIIGGRCGCSRIQLEWVHGPKIWNTYNLMISERLGYDLISEDLPPKHRIFASRLSGSSTEIRERRASGKPITNLVPPEEEGYILKHSLYLPEGTGNEEKDTADSRKGRCAG